MLKTACIEFPSGHVRENVVLLVQVDNVEVPYRCVYCGGITALYGQRYCGNEYVLAHDELSPEKRLYKVSSVQDGLPAGLL